MRSRFILKVLFGACLEVYRKVVPPSLFDITGEGWRIRKHLKSSFFCGFHDIYSFCNFSRSAGGMVGENCTIHAGKVFEWV